MKEEQPDLASAADLQIELLQVQRRVQSRVSLPAIRLDKDSLNAQLASAPVLQFEQLPLEWGELRFLLRAMRPWTRLISVASKPCVAIRKSSRW